MTDREPPDKHPYRVGETRPSSELEQLAAEGARRRAEVALQRAQEALGGDRAEWQRLRVTLAAYHKPPVYLLWRHIHVLLLLVVALMIVLYRMGLTPANGVLSSIGPLSAIGAYILFMTRDLRRASAPPSVVEAEEQWVRSFPFRIDGYFDVLKAEHEEDCHLRIIVNLVPAARPIPKATLLGVVAAFDPRVTTCDIHSTRNEWQSSTIDGSTDITVNDAPVYQSDGIPPYVHGLVERVLVPLHKEHPIAIVTISRS